MVLIEIDEEDNCITQDTSIRLKRAFKDYFEKNGVPEKAEDISVPELRELAKTYQEEFGEALDWHEQENAPGVKR